MRSASYFSMSQNSPWQQFSTQSWWDGLNERDLTAFNAAWLITYQYTVAMGTSLVEYAVEILFLPRFPKGHWLPICIGLLCVALGDCIRKVGIITAGSNFTLKIQTQKKKKHRLVTWGIYRYLRHPGYSGWLLWAIGTQILLCNPICTIAFAVIGYNFMKKRIAFEEQYLYTFFGDSWWQWKQEVPSGIPFIP